MNSLWRIALIAAENFVLICGALSLLAFAGSLFLRIASSKCSLQPLSLSRLFAAALLIPPAASAWIVIASLLPGVWLGSDKWVEEHGATHTFHLLNSFTFRYDPLLGYGALGFVFVTFGIVVFAAVRTYSRLDRLAGYLQVDTEPAPAERLKQVERVCGQHGLDVGLVVSRYPFSFVWGYRRSKLIVSTGLLNALTSDELSALLEHEAAHHLRRDNLMKWLLVLCRYLSPAFPFTHLLYRWWSEQIEMVCDEFAARRTQSAIEVAGALVRLRRLTLVPGGRKLLSVESSFFGESSDVLERRILRLLSLEQCGRREALVARSWIRAGAVLSGLFALTLFVVFAISPLSIHRMIEALLHTF